MKAKSHVYCELQHAKVLGILYIPKAFIGKNINRRKLQITSALSKCEKKKPKNLTYCHILELFNNDTTIMHFFYKKL